MKVFENSLFFLRTETGKKGAMVDCLQRIPKPGKKDLRNRATMTVLDMAAVIHMVKPGPKTHTFKD